MLIVIIAEGKAFEMLHTKVERNSYFLDILFFLNLTQLKIRDKLIAVKHLYVQIS